MHACTHTYIYTYTHVHIHVFYADHVEKILLNICAYNLILFCNIWYIVDRRREVSGIRVFFSDSEV